MPVMFMSRSISLPHDALLSSDSRCVKYQRQCLSEPDCRQIEHERSRSNTHRTCSHTNVFNISRVDNDRSRSCSIYDRENECSQHLDVRIPVKNIDDEAHSSIRKLNDLTVHYRTAMFDKITGHHVWLGIHGFVTIILLVLYFKHVIDISAGTLSICELLFGVIVRNEIFISVLHRLVALIPCFPYEFNRMLHCIGGLHTSSAVLAFLWLLISLGAENHGLGARITGGILLTFIILLSLTAMPVVRRRYHDTFEYTHRYAGWTSLVILLIHVVFLQIDKYTPFDINVLINVPVLVLVSIIMIVFLPWMCVHKVAVQFQQPSKDLTIVTFPHAIFPYGSTTRISLNGHEWHSFAIALTDACTDQHSILVAAVGDWTKKLAENCRNNQIPLKLWTRRIKGLGFMYSIHAYRKVLIVCTGSGIAPALPYIKDALPTTHTHLLWIAKQHETNYGEYVWRLVQKKQPHVTLHDTALQGRPGTALVEAQYWQTQSRAVFVVSNETYTNEVINALWHKGIPCFGALFDS
jgi:NAD(P)H-flavin reductase